LIEQRRNSGHAIYRIKHQWVEKLNDKIHDWLKSTVQCVNEKRKT
jgi:hypothetical protein